MNIIFGKEKLESIDSKYTVLELDTIQVTEHSDPITAYSIIETIPIVEISSIDQFRNLHTDLIKNYRLKNWKYCEDAIDHLKGKWNCEIDSFYEDLLQRIKKFKNTGVPEGWTGVIVRTKNTDEKFL